MPVRRLWAKLVPTVRCRGPPDARAEAGEYPTS